LKIIDTTNNNEVEMKVLVVDDSNFARRSLKKLLAQQLEGWEVIDTGASTEALDLFKEHSPTIVFLDLTMPIMSGEDVLEQIRSVDKECKVVILTADIQNKTKARIMELGANIFMNKPIDAEKLAEALVAIYS